MINSVENVYKFLGKLKSLYSVRKPLIEGKFDLFI